MNFSDFKRRILEFGETIYFELAAPRPGEPDWYWEAFETYMGREIKANSYNVLVYDPSDRTVYIDTGDGMDWFPTKLIFAVEIS